MFQSNDDVAAKRISNNERGLPVLLSNSVYM